MLRNSSSPEPESGGLSGLAFAVVVLVASAASFVIVSVVASKIQ
ncbi:hypothetical protein [Ferirhizobium litorale]|nr:hypothetical protein [Fererhizobium litorale]